MSASPLTLPVIHLDLFGGAAGFWLGMQQAGVNITRHYYSEIDPNAIAVANYHDQKIINLGSVSDIQHCPEQPTIITFGSPCQDFSLAGQRAGMEGERSSLILEAIRLISHHRPPLFIWENVKGAFSSNGGADFWAILQAFTNIGGYRLEWQLLNTAWFLPQIRERIYLIGHLDGASTPKVFPFGENDRLAKKTHPEERTTRGGLQIQTNRTAWALNTRMHKCGVDDNYVKYTQPSQQDRIYSEHGKMGALQAGTHGNAAHLTKTLVGDTIRRLTEIECERLQGFPDDWTRYGLYNGKKKEVSATQRYKLMGNAVSIPVVSEITKRLLKTTP